MLRTRPTKHLGPYWLQPLRPPQIRPGHSWQLQPLLEWLGRAMLPHPKGVSVPKRGPAATDPHQKTAPPRPPRD